ncbi:MULTISPECIES: hypothetical protein [Vibrio]|uniref:Uncharacterized protein n=1 Tax=Vibrio cortegadensis TaxID=1328770 RepID=A0ABV4M3V4_9VIBR|nr:hypothetical protein [Vibrio sp. 03-59-1]
MISQLNQNNQNTTQSGMPSSSNSESLEESKFPTGIPTENDDNNINNTGAEHSELTAVKQETFIEEERSKLNKQKNRNSHIELQIANEKRKAAEANRRTAEANAKATSKEASARKESSDGVWNSRLDRVLRWLKLAFLLVLLVAITTAAALGLYYLYRMVTEEPIIKTVTETVTETVEKEIIPEECTQVRRNGKVYVSCDGVTVQGAPTIAESGLDEIPELISE